jgi:hypothetical protein
MYSAVTSTNATADITFDSWVVRCDELIEKLIGGHGCVLKLDVTA